MEWPGTRLLSYTEL